MRTCARGRGIGPGCFKRRWGPTPAEIAYGDFRRGYTIVDRDQLSVLRDPFTQATSGNIRFIARRRVGGQVL